MQLCVHALEIGQHDFLLQNHFIEREDKRSFEEVSVENPQAQKASDELEIVEMLGVGARGRIDLERAFVMC